MSKHSAHAEINRKVITALNNAERQVPRERAFRVAYPRANIPFYRYRDTGIMLRVVQCSKARQGKPHLYWKIQIQREEWYSSRNCAYHQIPCEIEVADDGTFDVSETRAVVRRACMKIAS